ncbi:hypothetical protein HYV22_02385 [Candidatus Gottesmanbacteria bacterium]|nr:hypothetical protein [Candidatus Gottesmanbacteria bacterium]
MRWLFFGLLITNTILASWYVLHGDIFFNSDIGRDFLLLEELDQKKIVLIGPRSSGELYHGPLWTYLTYPAYLVGRGNPVIVGWFWVLLALVATLVSYGIGNALFSKPVGSMYALMVSLYLSFHTRGMSHPHAAMILIPLWFFCFVRYVTSSNIGFLIPHVILSGMIIQLELAPGIPLAALSIGALLYLIWKKQQYQHLGVLLLLPLTLGNFLIFDIRHEHILAQKLLGFITPYQGEGLFDYTMFIKNRLFLLFSSTEILRRDPGGRNLILFLGMLAGIALQLRDHNHVVLYRSFLYFYIGFFLLSFINKGPILYFHLYPLFLLVFLVFCSLLTCRYKKAYTILFVVIYAMNLVSSVGDAQDSFGHTGTHKYSWKFLSGVAKQVFSGPEKEFGYFVYSPDILGYEMKYTMHYFTRHSNKNIYAFKKMPVTYLVAAPHPPADPYMLDSWWRIHQVRITQNPERVIEFANGYKMEKYVLTKDEQQVYFDPAIDPGLHFR